MILIQLRLLPPFLQIFGGLVWILVACTYIAPANPQGWVMAVSVFCFTMTFIWLVVFACGVHQNKASWAAAVSLCTFSCMLKPVQREFSCFPASFSVRTLFITSLLRPSTSVLPRLWPTWLWFWVSSAQMCSNFTSWTSLQWWVHVLEVEPVVKWQQSRGPE